MIDIESCPVCDHNQKELFLQSKNFRITFEDFHIHQCSNCGFKFTSPLPTEEEIGKYYNTENYISHSETKKGIVNTIYHWVRKYTLGKKLKLVAKYTKNKSLLDIGSGSGRFLHHAKTKGWRVNGIEPDEGARKLSFENLGVEAKAPSELTNIPAKSFDAITMWHVLEHVYNLNEYIDTIKNVLTDEGTLFVAVPNCSSYDAKKYGKYWAAYDLPIHLYHFTPKDIKALFEKHNMKLIKVKPMVFDAYYISLESEKYKAGKDSYSLGMLIKGFWFGLLSNLKAGGNRYSSQIYILKKV